MRVYSYGKLFFGILFVFLGLAGIFNFFSVLTFGVPWQTWPVGLIIVGVLFMLNEKAFAFLGIFLLLILGIFNGLFFVGEHYIEEREFVYEFDVDDFEKVELDLNYGAGSIVLGGSGYGDKIYFMGTTMDFDDPRIRESFRGDVKEIMISREGGVGFGDEEAWKIFLAEDVVYDLDLEYGVSDVSLDLRELGVESLEISEGVSDTEIWFGDYSTFVDIDGGVSDVEFFFAEGSGVVIDVDGGLIDKDFYGFERRGGKWYSEGFDEGGENIVIEFDGGVSDIGSNFY